jgi:hypothetical protein
VRRHTRVDDARAHVSGLLLCDWELATDALRTANFATVLSRSQGQSYAFHVALLCDCDDSWMTMQAIDFQRLIGVMV